MEHKPHSELSPTPDRDRTTLGGTGAGGPTAHHNPPAAAYQHSELVARIRGQLDDVPGGGNKQPWQAVYALEELEEQLEATRSALHDLAEECFERMAAADLDAWDAPYRIEYPGDLVERARAVLNPAIKPKGDSDEQGLPEMGSENHQAEAIEVPDPATESALLSAPDKRGASGEPGADSVPAKEPAEPPAPDPRLAKHLTTDGTWNPARELAPSQARDKETGGSLVETPDPAMSRFTERDARWAVSDEDLVTWNSERRRKVLAARKVFPAMRRDDLSSQPKGGDMSERVVLYMPLHTAFHARDGNRTKCGQEIGDGWMELDRHRVGRTPGAENRALPCPICWPTEEQNQEHDPAKERS